MLVSPVNPSEAVIHERVDLHPVGTLFTRYGDWFPRLNILISILVLTGTVIMIFSKNRATKN
jgi:hypothetical protein